MKIKKIYIKLIEDREFRDYIIWGVVSAVVNVGLFKVFVSTGMEYRIANILTLLFNRIFCYLTNKFFVFHTKCENILTLLKEIISFFLARMVTFLIDYFGVVFLVEIIGMDSFISKLITSIIVIASNYTFSKLYVFKKRTEKYKE